MNYALAKELKDAGFPQGLLPNCFPEDWFEKDQVFEKSKEVAVYAPTLEELIEACEAKSPHGFGLIRNNALVEDYRWTAFDAAIQDLALVEEYGATPKIAVAHLWLTLQEHNNTSL